MGVEIIINATGVRLLGATTKEELIGRSVSDIIHPDDMADAFDRIRQRRAGESGAYPAEVRYQRLDGTSVPVLVTITPITFGQASAFQFIAHDITKRKQAEEALREREEQFRCISHAAQDAIIMVDGQGGTSFWSEAAVKMFGYTSGEVEGRNLHELIAPQRYHELHQQAWPHFHAVGQGNAIGKTIELVALHRSGAEFPVELSLASVQQHGQWCGVGIVRDITERKRAEMEKEKLEIQNRQLQKSESLARMAGAIAHHFNNQLLTVIMSLDMAKRAMSTGVNSLELVSDAANAARRAAEVSTLMLTYLGLSNQKEAAFDISDLCQRHLPILRVSVPPHVMLETDFQNPGPTVMASANQIQQVLSNLVTNAWEALCGNQGVVRLDIKKMAATDIPAVNRFPVDFQPEDKNHACLEVADTGCGIPAREIEKIFDPFFSTKFTGRGLGLAVVLGIVRAHHGVITVESNLGHGTSFRVYLPMLAEAPLQNLKRSAPD